LQQIADTVTHSPRRSRSGRKTLTFDKSIKMYDEPHAPEHLERMMATGSGGRGKFLTAAHQDSYRLQMQELRDLRVSRVLEIGPGEGFVSAYMRTLGIMYDTMDIVQSSFPTILSKLEDVDAKKYAERYDAVCAFQMLEHSPYEKLVPNLLKMAEMSRKYVFISLPYSCIGFKTTLAFSFGQKHRWEKTIGFYLPLNRPNRRYRPEFMQAYPWAVHYWEIGRRGFPWKRVKTDIESTGLEIVKTFHSGNPFHYFVLTQKRTSAA
jgi:hypothetical protein